MDYRHSYAGDRIWKHTKGIDLKNLQMDLLGEGREESFGRVRPRRENGYLLAPKRMAEVKSMYDRINYKYKYSIVGYYSLALLTCFKMTNMGMAGKLLLPTIGCYFLYKYQTREGVRQIEDLTKELYFEVDQKYRDFRYSGDISRLGDHVEVLQWEEIKKRLIQ